MQIFLFNKFSGKEQVILNCKQTAKYFKKTQTNFSTDDVVIKNNKVIRIGTAEFIKDGEIVNTISACDIYEFNEENLLEKISSYCIPIKK